MVVWERPWQTQIWLCHLEVFKFPHQWNGAWCTQVFHDLCLTSLSTFFSSHSLSSLHQQQILFLARLNFLTIPWKYSVTLSPLPRIPSPVLTQSIWGITIHLSWLNLGIISVMKPLLVVWNKHNHSLHGAHLNLDRTAKALGEEAIPMVSNASN